MKNEVKNSIKNTIGNLLTKGRSEYTDYILFFRHYSELQLDESEIIDIVSAMNIDCDMLYYEYSKDKIQDAFCPFMEFIRELYNKYYKKIMTAQEFVEKAGGYKALTYLFVHYLENGWFDRYEDVLPQEVEYEKIRIVESIINFIKYISREHKLVMVLDNVHLVQLSSLKIIENIIGNRAIKNIAFIGSYDESYNISSYRQGEWSKLMNLIRNLEITIEYDGVSENYNVEETEDSDGGTTVAEYIETMRDLCMVLAFEQGNYYMTKLLRTLDNSKLVATQEEEAQIYFIKAMIEVFTKHDKEAFVSCKKMYDLECTKNNNKILYMYYVINAIINTTTGQHYIARKMIKNGLDLIDAHPDEFVEHDRTRLEMMEIVEYLSKNPNVLFWDPNMSIPKELIQKAKDKGQLMHVAYAYLFGFNLASADTQEREENRKNFEEGLAIAEKLDNVKLQIRGWQSSGAQASAYGDFRDTLYFYNKSLDIMKGNDMKLEEAEIDNGIGYDCIVNEKYDLAYDYFHKAIDLGIKIEVPGIVLDAVYNMTALDIQTGNYDEAIGCANLTLKMMNMLKLERLNVCNKSKVLGLAIFAYLKKKQIYNAKMYYDNMATVMQHLLSSDNPDYSMWEDDMYLYYVVSAMIAMEDGRYEVARRYFDHADALWQEINSKQLYILPRVIQEEVRLCELMGETIKKEEIIIRSAEFCRQNKMLLSAANIDNLLFNKEFNREKYKTVLTEELVERINVMTARSAMKKEVEKKNKMLNFFETWVDSINIPAGSESEMISNAVEMIKNTFDIDRVLYISVINGIPVIKYYDSSVDIQQYQLQYIMDFFKKNKRRILVSRLKKSYKFHEEFISAFNRNDLSSLLAIPFYENEEVSDIFIAFKNKRANFTENLSMIYEDEADILRTSFRELIEAINREQIKRQLEKSSVTDTLTGIDNRHGLVVKVNKEIERIKRLEKAEELFTILYMDLDNFKFCNDNFGHDAGDAVLVSFSAMLKSIVGEDGIVVRYGGDEFIIIIPNKNVNYGESIANKIFRNIGYNRGFVKAIESTITGKISISDENRITCSIGIASGVVKEYDDISVILKKADKALYAVKNGSKHDYKIWEE